MTVSNNLVSCICITHNRVDMLKKAISYFDTQTYKARELVILYLNEDVKTSSFVEKCIQYNYGVISETDFYIPEIFIQSKTNIHKHYTDFRDEEEITVIIKASSKNDIFVDGFYYATPDYITIKSIDEELLIINDNGSYHWSKPDATEESEIKVVVQFDNSIKLYNSSLAEKNHELLNKGWAVEKKRVTESNIFFYEIKQSIPISLGYRRNMAISLSMGEYICVWDDDDWFAPERIFNQMNFIEFTKKPACALVNQVIFNHNTQNAYISCPRPEGWENSLICKKSDMGQYEDLPKKEDTPLLLRIWKANNIAVIDDPYLYIYNLHKTNVSGNSHFHQILSFSRKINEEHYEVVKDRILSYSS